MIELKLAWRNITRHRRKSLMTLLAIMTGVAGIIVFSGFIEANYSGLRESVIRSQYGHMQVHQKGYLEYHRNSPAEYRLTPDTVDEYMNLVEDDERVLVTSPRLEFTGLLGNETTSQAAIIRGVDADKETLINSALTIIDGSELYSDEEDAIIVGEGLAASLNSGVGDILTLLAANDNGVMNAVDVRIVGIFRSFAKEYDDRAMMMNISQAQLLLDTEDVDKLVVLLSDTPLLDGFVADLQQHIDNKNLQLEYQMWHQMATFYHKVVDLYDGFFLFINIVIIAIVLLSITNTMIVTVMERTFEIGTTRALGVHRSNIVFQFVTEGALLALLSGLAGIALGAGVSSYITSLDIMMSPPPGSSQGFPLSIMQVPQTWIVSIIAVVLVAVIATFVPAYRAAKQNIVDALRHV